MDSSDLRAIYEFWFGTDTPADRIDVQRIQYWMYQSDDTDRDIREKFGHLIPEAAGRQWDIDALSREEAMGLLILFDQFPRNIFRTTGDAFAYDHLARPIARKLVDRGLENFTASERFFLGLPFGHHEDTASQDFGVLIAAQDAVAAPEHMQEATRRSLDFATKHRDLIRRFGRFPHRNAMLGRESTPEELAFLKEHGRGF